MADPDADILYGSSNVRGDNIVTILPETAPEAYLKHLRDRNISYLFAGQDGKDLRAAMQTLAENFGVKSLSLQGGFHFNLPIYRQGESVARTVT